MTDRNLVWDYQSISTKSRQNMMKQKGCVLWFTGLSGSGKSTIASKVEELLFQQGFFTYRLDGDNVRHGLCKDLGFSEEDRFENIRRVSEVSHLMADAGLIVLATFISPIEEYRACSRAILKEYYHLIYIKATLETVIKRDPKGLYQKALNHEIKDFTGISQPFDEPLSADLIIDTDQYNIEECVRQCVDYFKNLQK